MPKDSLEHQLAAALVAGLKTIGHDETKWRTKPKTVELNVAGFDLDKPTPAIFVGQGRSDTTPGSSDQWWEEAMSFSVVCVSQDAGNPHRALSNLVADVRQFLRENVRGEGFAGIAAVVGGNGAIFDRGYEPWWEKSDGSVGRGVGIVRVEVHAVTTDAAELA